MMQSPGRRACYLFAFLALAASWLLGGCGEAVVQPGWIATVNGEGISFQEAEARRIALFARRTPEAVPPDEERLQKQYRYVVSRLVEERIICQFMEKKSFQLDPALLENAEAQVRKDYPGGTFAKVFLEEGISQELWREGLRRRLIVEQFINRELRPEISISAAEVEKYYTENSKDFIVPEQWHFLQITGLDSKEVEKAQADLVENKNAAAVQKDHLVSIHDISMAWDLLPDTVQKALENLAPWQASAPALHEDQFRGFVLVEIVPERRLDPATISKRVEQVLIEKKLKGIYAEWLNKNLAKNKISIAPALFRPVALSSPGRAASPVLKSPSLPVPMLDFEPSGDEGP